MRKRNKEEEILRMALERLEQATELTAEVDPEIDPEGPDAVVRITWQNMEWCFAADVKYTLTRAMIGVVVQQLRRHFEKCIIVTRYVTPQVAELLKEANIPFLDAAGNAYLNEPPLFVFIKGNKPTEMYFEKPPIRAFRPTGLQVIFALLCNPGLEKEQYREIAKAAGVALGTVCRVMRDLRQMGNLVDMGRRGRRLIQKEKLLRRWVTDYPEQLRPKRLMGRFRANNTAWWKDGDPGAAQAYWGGEVAANMLTKHLKPQNITVYMTNFKAGFRFLIVNRLQRDPEGDIEIIETFWNFEHEWQYDCIVHPILIYADLLATGDARNIETAEMIYEQELTRFIRED